MSPPPFRVQPDDPQYIADAAGEAEFWNKPRYFSTNLAIALPQEAPFEAYANNRLTGDPKTRWFDTIPSFGDFRNGLFFGVSDRDLEAHVLDQNPNLNLTLLDISPESLALRMQAFASRFPGRTDIRSADLNFVALPPNTYDVIISMSVLHHLQNIEWVAYQINQSLAPGGYFFLYDYVAETRLQFHAKRRSIFEALVARAKRNGDVPTSWEVRWPVLEPWTYSPFEAVRCEDTLDVLSAHLDPVSIRGSAALTALTYLVSLDAGDVRRDHVGQHMWRAHPHSLRRRLNARLGRDRRPAMSKRFQDELFLLDTLLTDSGLLSPLVAFAVYRKRA